MAILSTAQATLAKLDALHAALADGSHRNMLASFRTHWLGEVTGDLDLAMSVLPDDSHFCVQGVLPVGAAFEVNTAAEHRAIYQQAIDIGLCAGGTFSSERFAFADWGIIMEAVHSNILYGRLLANLGSYDADALFLCHFPMTIVIPFSPSGQMLGKRDYFAAPLSIEPADRDMLQRLIALQ